MMSETVVGTQRSFAQLRATAELTHEDDSALGPIYGTRDPLAPRRVRVFDVRDDLRLYVTLHKYGHMWVHRDCDHNMWLALAIAQPVEVGVDFVMMPRHFGNTLEAFLRNALAMPPPRLGELRTLMPKLLAAADDAVDVWITRLVSMRLTSPDPQTFYDPVENRFVIQDLMPTREDLAMWHELTSHADD